MSEGNKIKILETDLYKPIYDYLTDRGYTVRGEVKNCDITAIKNDELLIIELKRSFNLELLIQAAYRQRSADKVYVAVPYPKGKSRTKQWHGFCHLLKRLEVGLITIAFYKTKAPLVEVEFDPCPFERKKMTRHRTLILKEISGRTGDYNSGGCNKTKIMTAYRENALHIACCLEKHGQLSPKQLQNMGTGKKTTPILGKNYFGWFQKIKRGTYELSDYGKNALSQYLELAEYYRTTLNVKDEN